MEKYHSGWKKLDFQPNQIPALLVSIPLERVVDTSNDLTRLELRDEATFIGNPLNGGNRVSKSSSRGREKIAQRTLELQMNEVLDFST
ncbi:hypothetical protein AVEN_23247-1 [Araneus ventricosus]|uniref:Uncharacterized protein n=1 Tax=Araneus ventricosus TaxID=182803 RepID=A0A4Y2RXL7_ARAVE|nr:hypothetical protein AVEN_23247-1 [Araneus ventricosus]